MTLALEMAKAIQNRLVELSVHDGLCREAHRGSVIVHNLNEVDLDDATTVQEPAEADGRFGTVGEVVVEAQEPADDVHR